MSLKSLMKDTITLLKKDGSKIEGIRASVQDGKIFLNADKLLIEPEDVVQRTMSNGAEETFLVIDPGFYEAFHGIQAHYQMKVKKLGLPEAKQAIQNITYNISGSNARVNNNSIDNSTNFVQTNSEIIKNIGLLRKELSDSALSEDEKSTAFEVIDTLEEQFNSGNPKRSVVSVLLNSLPHVANVATIAAAIIDML